MQSDKRPIILAMHWPRFGPYHLARLNAAFQELKPAGIEVVGLETANQDKTYAWRQESGPTIFERHVAFPGRTYEQISPLLIWKGMMSVLDRIDPQAIAICGYSTHDAWSALAWCKLHRRAAILMTDTKWDDAPRTVWKEGLKRRVVRQFATALCGGSLHRKYLEQLGMKPERIFEGCAAVDNDYFWQGAERARQNPDAYRSLPGLESPEPFFLASARFIKCKNLDGLLRAYVRYRRRSANTGKSLTPWRLVILGDGVERDALEHLVYSESIQGVSFAGFRQIEELPIYYGLASVFIHPAYKDTWGLVVNEAMAAGLPVLVSNRCGCAPDLVSDGNNGFTFSPEDVTALADLMMKVSSGQVNLQAMSLAARNRIGERGPKRFAQGLYGALQVALQ